MPTGFGLPGQSLAGGNRLAAALMARQNTNNGTIAGGLGTILQQALLGMMLGSDRDLAMKERADTSAAGQAMMRGAGAKPWVNPDAAPGSGGPTTMGTAGGYEGAMAALSGLGDNLPAGRLSEKLMLEKMATDRKAAEMAAALKNAIALKQVPGAPVPGRDVPLPQSVAEQQAAIAQGKRTPVPGRDVPYEPDVFNQQVQIAGAKAAALRPDIDTLRAEETAKKEAAAAVAKTKVQPKALAALNDLERQANVVTTHIDKALGLVGPFSTGFGSWLDRIPNTDARALRNELDTIKANVGFDKLQQLRDNSPTGGALGQVSEMENRLLQAVNGALDPGQADQLVENLKAIRDIYPQVLAERRAAYIQDYGDRRKAQDAAGQPAPDAPAPAQGGGIKFLGFE